MLTPVVAERPARPYVAIRAQVTRKTMDDILLPLQPQVFAWMRERGIPAAGPRWTAMAGNWPACSRRAGTRPGGGTPVISTTWPA
jgi:hypothetical protein